jgi:hypothetical protein
MELNITEFIKKETNLKDGNKLQEFTERELNILIYKALKEQLILSDVVDTLVCDIVKGTRCKDSFANYRDGVCYVCGGQAN